MTLPAAAQAAGSSATAKKAKKAGRYAKKAKKAYRRGDYDDAIAAFELAHDANADPKHLFNIGRCHEKKGELFRAMEFVQRYVEQVTDESEKEDAAELHAILRKRLLKAYGELLLESDPDESGVRLEGEDGEVRRMKTPVATWLPAGTWKVRIAAPDLQPWEGKLVIVIGETLAQEVELKAVAAPPEEPEPEPEPEPKPEPEPEAPGAEAPPRPNRRPIHPPPRPPTTQAAAGSPSPRSLAAARCSPLGRPSRS